jgi:hypothetical protein
MAIFKTWGCIHGPIRPEKSIRTHESSSGPFTRLIVVHMPPAYYAAHLPSSGACMSGKFALVHVEATGSFAWLYTVPMPNRHNDLAPAGRIQRARSRTTRSDASQIITTASRPTSRAWLPAGCSGPCEPEPWHLGSLLALPLLH